MPDGAVLGFEGEIGVVVRILRDRSRPTGEHHSSLAKKDPALFGGIIGPAA